MSTDLIIGAAPAERAGAAAAISETGSEMGGALGIAVLGSIGTAIYRGSSGARADLAGVSENARTSGDGHAGRSGGGGRSSDSSDAASAILLDSRARLVHQRRCR